MGAPRFGAGRPTHPRPRSCRAIKPAMYAEAAIPVYWRVELQDAPKIVVSSLSRGRYVTRTTLTAGSRGRITRPFAVEIDPADLTRRTA